MSDIYCRKSNCGEPWDAYHLRHEMAWRTCRSHQITVTKWSDGEWHHADPNNRNTYNQVCPDLAAGIPVLHIEPADNGLVPALVQRWCAEGEPGWLRFVAQGHGCPACYGTDAGPQAALSLTELDDLDVATEGRWLP